MSNKTAQSFHYAKPIFSPGIIQKKPIASNHSIILGSIFNAKKSLDNIKIILSEFGIAFFKPWMPRAVIYKILVFHSHHHTTLLASTITY
jgi:hypothetical protein